MKSVFKNIERFYFIGIGGIGMSNLARYFMAGGFEVAGYDKTPGLITGALINEGIDVVFEDSTGVIPERYADLTGKGSVVVVYTPAVPASNSILNYFRVNGFRVEKRAAILGVLSTGYRTLAIAGTHGKTTISTITAHLLKQSAVDCSAFLGGIARNYNTNLLLGEGGVAVMEADEYDRSFHHLEPSAAVISSLDADHLDIYGTHEVMIDSFRIFSEKIKHGGALFLHRSVYDLIPSPESVDKFSYGVEDGSDYQARNIELCDGYYQFDIQTPDQLVANLRLPLPGMVNIENCTAATAISLWAGVTPEEIRKSLIYFKGVVRRFDIRFNDGKRIYIDDYAHHPGEIDAFIKAVRDFFPGRKITGIFQPHLYTRTRDNAEGFACSLDKLDEIILLPIYPAREEPIDGVNSEMIMALMKNPKKRIVEMSDVVDTLDWDNTEIVVTIGAGDIDRLVDKLENRIRIK